jgi:hypothetical protein
MPLMNATGYWDVADYGSTPWYNSGMPDDEVIEDYEAKILRSLAAKVSEIAQRPEQKEKKDLWAKHNRLAPTRPLVICDPENGWNEVITGDMLKCRNRLARHWEMVLRKEIFWGEQLKDDKPIEKNFDINYTYEETDWGIDIRFSQTKEGGSYVWEPGLKDYCDIDRIKFPKISVDFSTTQKTIKTAKDIFGDLLNVRLNGKWWWSNGLTYELVTLRGMEQSMLDMIDNPKFFHELMQILKTGTIEKIRFLEKNGLLTLNNDLYLPPGGFGYTDELPGPHFNGNVLTRHLWNFSESQETVGVSPKMFEEFIFPYQYEIQKLFGLNSYGCCEPLHKRWNVIKEIPRLRKVSVSPWSDKKKMAEYLKDQYCYCLKPSPTPLSLKNIDEERIRYEIRSIFEIIKECRVEVLMQDNHTIGNNPENIIQWVRIVKEEAARIAS